MDEETSAKGKERQRKALQSFAKEFGRGVRQQRTRDQRKSWYQGAKKIIFTAFHSGKLKLAFTSPDVISTSPKKFLFFCNSNSS